MVTPVSGKCMVTAQRNLTCRCSTGLSESSCSSLTSMSEDSWGRNITCNKAWITCSPFKGTCLTLLCTYTHFINIISIYSISFLLTCSISFPYFNFTTSYFCLLHVFTLNRDALWSFKQKDRHHSFDSACSDKEEMGRAHPPLTSLAQSLVVNGKC